MKPPKDLRECEVSVMPKGKLTVVRIECMMPFSPEQVLEVQRIGLGAPQNITATALTHSSQELPESMSLTRIEVKLPIVKDRDFVMCQHVTASPVSAVVRTSVPKQLAAELCPESKKYVRGNIILQVTIVTESDQPGYCAVKSISCVDPSGVP